jgi:predicted nucleotidyltransferase
LLILKKIILIYFKIKNYFEKQNNSKQTLRVLGFMFKTIISKKKKNKKNQ